MSEQAVMDFAVEAEPTQMESASEAGESSFAEAFESALSRLDKPQEQAPPQPTEEVQQPEEKQPDAEKPAEEQPEEKSSEEPEVEAPEDAEEGDYDPTNDLDTEDTTDWTPKAARRFKQLKEERKVLRTEVEDLRQKTQEYESKIQELSGAIDSEDIESMREQLAEYEQQKMYSDLEDRKSVV